MATAAVLFDLDGVLIDTQQATRQALHTLAATRATVRVEDVDAHIGLPPIEALTALGVADAADLYQQGFDAALADALGDLRTFDPAVQGLVELARLGVGVAVVTAQARRRLPILLPDAVAAVVDVVIAGDDVARGKPDPEGILTALDHLGVSPHQAMFVGDTVVDLMAAWRAGVHAIGAGWGYTGEAGLRQAGAEVVLTDPAQIGPRLLTYLDNTIAGNTVLHGGPR